MHRITTPRRPVEVETAVSGTSTPSSIGEVRNDQAERFLTEAENVESSRADAGFLVEWVNLRGEGRFCGKASGGISAESVVRLIDALVRNGVSSVFTVTRTR